MKAQRESRRDFLKTTGAAAAATLAACRSADRPNILWITAEDLSPVLGCYGDENAYTPHLDELARQGVRYTNAYATAPLCTPARSCLITGVHAISMGTQNLRGEMPMPRDVRCYTEFLREAGYYCSNNVKEDYNFHVTPPAAWDESSDTAHWRNRGPGQPFFSIFNLMTTHQSQVRYSREKWTEISAQLRPEERHFPGQMKLPPYYPDTPDVRLNMATLHTQVTRMDKQVGEYLAQLETDGLAEDTIVFFYADHGTGLPRGKRWLHDSGIRVPLIIRFPKKYEHLAPNAAGTTSDRLVSFVDFPPTMLSLTGLKIPAYMQGRPFLGRQEGEPNRHIFAARDRVDEVLEVSRTITNGQFQYIRNYLPHRPRMQRSDYSELTPIRKELRRLDAEGKLEGDERWLMAPSKPVEELYDRVKDPHQLRNLAGAPEHQEGLALLRRILQEWMIEVRDTGLLPEPELARRSGDRSPYDMARAPGEYPVERVLEAAELVGRGPAKLPELEKALADSDSAVRYWGAVGMVALRAEAAPAAAALRKAAGDENVSVRIAAAEALCHIGEESAALPVLIRAVEDDDARVALLAAISLQHIGEKARPALPALRRAAASKSGPANQRQYVGWALNGVLENLRA